MVGLHFAFGILLQWDKCDGVNGAGGVQRNMKAMDE